MADETVIPDANLARMALARTVLTFDAPGMTILGATLGYLMAHGRPNEQKLAAAIDETIRNAIMRERGWGDVGQTPVS